MQPNDGVSTLNHLFFYHLDHYRFDRLLSFQNRGELMVWSTERFSRAVFALRQFLRGYGSGAWRPGGGISPRTGRSGTSRILPCCFRAWWWCRFTTRYRHRRSHTTCGMAVAGRSLSPAQHNGRLCVRSCRNWRQMETIVAMEETPGVKTSLPRIVAEAPGIRRADRGPDPR